MSLNQPNHEKAVLSRGSGHFSGAQGPVTAPCDAWGPCPAGDQTAVRLHVKLVPSLVKGSFESR